MFGCVLSTQNKRICYVMLCYVPTHCQNIDIKFPWGRLGGIAPTTFWPWGRWLPTWSRRLRYRQISYNQSLQLITLIPNTDRSTEMNIQPNSSSSSLHTFGLDDTAGYARSKVIIVHVHLTNSHGHRLLRSSLATTTLNYFTVVKYLKYWQLFCSSRCASRFVLKSRGVASSKNVGWTHKWRTRGARAYNGGLGAEPPAGSRGRAPGQGGEAPLKLKTF